MFFRCFKRKKGPTQKEVLRKKFHNFAMELKRRGFSGKTIDIYLYYNGKFLDFIKKQQNSISSKDIKSYLNYLVEKNVEPRTLNMALNSLKAYYTGYLGKKLFHRIRRSKVPKNMPNVLTREEIKKMVDNSSSLKHRLLIELLYSSGMRVGECIRVKLKDIDFDERIIFVEKGKGKKDRFVITSKRFIDDLKKYLKIRRKKSDYLFDNHHGKPFSSRAAQEIVSLAAKKAGIQKRVYPHLLRASFATHLFEDDIRTHKIQKLLGHSDRRTTEVYIRPRTDDIKEIKSPLDRLYIKKA